MKEYTITFKPLPYAVVPVMGFFYGNDKSEAVSNAVSAGFKSHRIISITENEKFKRGHI